MIVSDTLKRIRDVRTKEGMAIKPSPYLRDSFIDEYGEEHKVVVRDYQKQGIMNCLMLERCILADDTGLGKTLQVLSTIGYVWMKEPEYVPIIITTKSALYQWKAEAKKFMKDMDVVVIHAEPYKRQDLYQDFFWRHDPEKKRVMIITYDTARKDMERQVVADRSKKPNKEQKKALAEAREKRDQAKITAAPEKVAFEEFFKPRDFEVHQFLEKVIGRFDRQDPLEQPPPKPGGWDNEDEQRLVQYLRARLHVRSAEAELTKVRNIISPPTIANGILDYVQDLRSKNPGSKFMLVMDEMHKLKNHKSQFHLKIDSLAVHCQRAIGMTATPVKNRLMEFWSLYHIVKPDLFPKITQFQNEFCITKMQPIGGGRKVPVVVGYKNLDEFVRRAELYYLSRKKYDVAKELPALISQERECELYDEQETLYDLAEVMAAEKAEAANPDDENAAENGGAMLAALTLIQQAVNSPCLIMNENGEPFEGPSAKVDSIMELLEDEIVGAKVIIFSKFEKMISLIERTLKEAKYKDEDGIERKGYKCVRITGNENKPEIREKHKNLFQDPNSGVNIVLITMAGSESINLHAAEHFVFVDLPWSWGDYVQLTGRSIRIGSQHKVVVAHHLLGKKQNGEDTIDHHVLAALRAKKKLSDKVAGESLKSALHFTADDVVKDVFALIRAAQAGKKAGDKGTLLDQVNQKIADSVSKKSGKKKAAGKAEEPPKVETVKDYDVSIIDFSDI